MKKCPRFIHFPLLKTCKDLSDKFCGMTIQEAADSGGVKIIFHRCTTPSIKSATREKKVWWNLCKIQSKSYCKFWRSHNENIFSYTEIKHGFIEYFNCQR